MDSAIVTFLSNAGTAGVVVILIITGWLVPKWAHDRLLEENRLLREALELERQRATEAASTASTTNQLIGALTQLAEQRRALPSPAPPDRDPAASWKDLAL